MEHNFPNMFLVIVEPSWCKYWGILYLATYSQHHLQCVCHMNVPRFPSATRLIVCRHFPRKRHLRWMICLEGERCWFQTCRASVFGVSSVFQQNLDKYVWHSRWKVTASVSLRKGTVNEETLGLFANTLHQMVPKKNRKTKTFAHLQLGSRPSTTLNFFPSVGSCFMMSGLAHQKSEPKIATSHRNHQAINIVTLSKVWQVVYFLRQKNQVTAWSPHHLPTIKEVPKVMANRKWVASTSKPRIVASHGFLFIFVAREIAQK